MSDTTPNQALAAVNATVPDALELRSLSVIGLMQAHDGAAALLRSGRGRIARVHVGQTALGVRVDAIDASQVVVTDRWGRTLALALPRS